MYHTVESLYSLPPIMYPDARPSMWVPLRCWRREDIVPFEPEENLETIPAAVTVNHGRWVVECFGCHSAQVPSATDQWFFCQDCLNVDSNYMLRPLLWPVNPNACDIVGELSLRPLDENRNWYYGESLEELRMQTMDNCKWVCADTSSNNYVGTYYAPDKINYSVADIELFTKRLTGVMSICSPSSSELGKGNMHVRPMSVPTKIEYSSGVRWD